MKFILTTILGLFLLSMSYGQDFDLPELSPFELSPQIQSPLYQSFNSNDFDLLVKNVNVFASSKPEVDFDFVQASTMRTNRYSNRYFNEAINRQMAQYSSFKVEIDNSKNLFMDYHDEPIYSGLNRVRNDAFIEANRLNPGFRGGSPLPLLYTPSLSSRRGVMW
jgi:hypothetical protein